MLDTVNIADREMCFETDVEAARKDSGCPRSKQSALRGGTVSGSSGHPLAGLTQRAIKGARAELKECFKLHDKNGLDILLDGYAWFQTLRAMVVRLPVQPRKPDEIDLRISTAAQEYLSAKNPTVYRYLKQKKNWPAGFESAPGGAGKKGSRDKVRPTKPSKGPSDQFRAFFLTSNSFMPLPHDLLRCLAFRTLKATHQWILVDMIAKWQRAARKDRANLDANGFPYSFRYCDYDASGTTFKEALKEIVAHGFFSVHPDYHPASKRPKRFVYSEGWKQYEPTDQEMKRLEGLARSKATALESNMERLRGLS